MSDWKQKAREDYKEMTEGDRIQIKEGPNCVRILPNKKDILPTGAVGPKGLTHLPYRRFKMHYGLGPIKNANDRGRAAACGHGAGEEDACWLCDVKIPELMKGDTRKKMMAKRIQAKECLLLQASTYDADTEKFSKPKPWSVAAGLQERIMGKIKAKKDFVDPAKGHNINIERNGMDLHTRYDDSGDESPTVVPPEVLKKLVDFDTLAPRYDKEDQIAAYSGRDRKQEEAEEEEDGEDRDEKTEDEETEEQAEEAEETAGGDEEEEPKDDEEDAPAPKPAKKPARAFEDEEEQILEEEDAKPAKRAANGKPKPPAPPDMFADDDDDAPPAKKPAPPTPIKKKK